MRRSPVIVLALSASALVVLVGGVAIGRMMSAEERTAGTQQELQTEAVNPPRDVGPSNPLTADRGLQAEFDELQRTLNADVGLALSAVGREHSPTVLGTWAAGPAWSTIKVPLVIAALRDSSSSLPSPAMIDAITKSDNDAATEVWEGLGDPETAARKVDEVLRETGDPTIVQSRKVRPEFTAFGQTIWPLTDQLRFMAAVVCEPANEAVLDLMGQITVSQRWGVGALTEARFKGGWGPSTDGAYLVRQMGVIPTPSGMTAVALAASPSSGSLADGEAALNAVAEWIKARSDLLPAGTCS